MAFKFFLKVIAGNYFSLVGALRKDDPYLLALVCFALQRKGWAGSVSPVAFVEVDDAPFHDLVDILLADVAAIHTAKGVFSIVDV